MTNHPSQPLDKMQAAFQGASKPQFGTIRIRNRGRLPHWEREAGLYFVTFRLADSLPAPVLEKITERHRILEAAKRTGVKLRPDQKLLVEEFSTRKLEEYFDRGVGKCHLARPEISAIVANALRFWDRRSYRLIAWCIMPNHVHAVFRLLPGHDLADVLRTWKSYTARMANRILERRKQFWQREYYDRLIRNGEELSRAVDYVLKNPERAGLKNWTWVWSADLGSPRDSRSGDQRS